MIGRAVLRNVLAPSGCLGWLVFIFIFIIPTGVYYFNITMGSLAQFQLENLKDSEYLGFLANFIIQSGIELSVLDINKHFILIPSLIFCPVAMVFFGSQLIAKDKAANALQVYFSKAISRMDYVLGKFFAVGVMTAAYSLVPTVLILTIGLFFNTDLVGFMSQSFYIPLLSMAYWLLLTLVLGSVTLVFSALFNKSYMAAVGLIGFPIFCLVMSFLLVSIFGATDLLNGLNWFMSIFHIGWDLFSLSVDNWNALFWRLFDLAVLVSLAIFIIFKKINPVEVIQ